jgi:transposase-like protein
MQPEPVRRLTPIVIGSIRYYAAADIARALGISRQTLWRWRRAKAIPLGRRFRDGRILYTIAEVEAIKEHATRLEPVGLGSPSHPARVRE